MSSLRDVFVGASRDPVRAHLGGRADLAKELEALVARCRSAHPSVVIDGERFVRHLAEQLEDVDPGTEGSPFSNVHVEDLWLALGCADGDTAALASFERSLAPQVEAALKHLSISAAQKQDVAQAVRERLLVAKPGARPKIADYSGRGPLAGWVRVAATRTALSMLRRKDAATATPVDDLPEMADTLDDPELEHVRARHREDFKAAFQDALRSLSPHDRTVLRLYLVDQLNIERIGALYNVHRATVARWIARSRDSVRDETKRLLCDRLRVEGSELESLVRVVQGELDVSMSRILREGDD